jgi:hypothetical protein
LGDIPQEFGAELVIERGSANSGRVSFGLTGGWYAPADGLAAVITPYNYLNKLPTPSVQTVTPGTYIASVENLGGTNQLNTTGIPDKHDTFYAKPRRRHP